MINFTTYEYWPNIKKMTGDNLNKYDFIALGLECSIPALQDKRDVLMFVTYIVLDKYNNDMKLNFDFSMDKDGYPTYWSLKERKQKPDSVKKVIKIDGDSVNLKSISTLSFDKNTLPECFEEYLTNVLLPRIADVLTFSDKHKINYEESITEQWKQYLLHDFKKLASAEFIERFIDFDHYYTHQEIDRKKTKWLDFLSQTARLQSYEKLNNTLPSTAVKSRLKI